MRDVANGERQDRYDDLVPVYKAARVLKLSPSYVRDTAIKRGLAVKFPGRKKIKIPLTEFRRMLAGLPKQPHRLVTC